MKRIIFHIGIISLLILSCQSREPGIAEEKLEEQKKISMEIIQLNLEKQLPIEIQNPFIIREFVPYLNGKWIGKAISYGCYRKGQAPGIKGPSESEILQDLEII